MMKGLRSLRSRWDTVATEKSATGNVVTEKGATRNRTGFFTELCASTTLNFRAAIVAIATLALSACGGGGGGGGGFLPEDPNAGLTNYTLELSLTDGAGNRVTTVSGAQTAILSVTVREDNSGGLPVEGELVSASVGFAILAPENGSAVTDADGIAIFEITGGDTTGGDEVVVTVTAPAGTVTASLAFQIEEVVRNSFSLTPSLTDTDGISTQQVAPASPAILRGLLTSTNVDTGEQGIPVVGEIVEATLSDGTISPENGRKITNSEGIAEFTISPGTTLGAQTATLVYTTPSGGTVQSVIPFEVVADSPVPGFEGFTVEMTLRNEDGNVITGISGSEPAILDVQVLGRRSSSSVLEPVQGIPVSVVAERSVVNPEGGTVLTDENGIAQFIVSAGTVAGADTLTATVLGPNGPVREILFFNVDTAAFFPTLRLLDSTGQPSQVIRIGEPLTLEVQASNTDGEPIVGALVEATTTVAAVDPGNGQATTDSNGIATFTLSENGVSGADSVSVTLTVGTTSIVRSINYQVQLPRYQLLLAVDATATTSRSANLQVQVVPLDDPPGNVNGLVVQAAAQFGVAQLDSAVSITNPDGVTSFRIFAGSQSGGDQIDVTVQVGAVTLSGSIGVEVIVEALRLGGFVNGAFVDRQIGVVVPELPVGGVTRINLGVFTAAFQPPEQSVSIRLSSACSLDGLAGFRPVGSTGPGSSSLVVSTAVGLAEAEYVAGNCVGTDALQAILVDEPGVTANGQVTIFQPAANYIGWFSSDPSEGPETGDRTVLALAQTGGVPQGRAEFARVTFEVLEERPGGLLTSPSDPNYLDREDRVPIPGAVVTFSLSSDLDGITVCNLAGDCTDPSLGVLSVDATTGADGLVEVIVNAGNVPGQTFVIASFTNPESGITINSASNQIVISTGLPDQDSFSLAVAPIAPDEFPSMASDTVETIAITNAVGPPQSFSVSGARSVDFTAAAILTVRLADRFNNPVPDGTAALFRTELGAIDSSCETGKVNGSRYIEGISTVVPRRGTCSVLWTAQEPRGTSSPFTGPCSAIGGYTGGPCPNVPGTGLRSTILTYILGEEVFTDNDGDGLFDSATDTFDVANDDLPEAFLDANEDRVFNAGVEEFLDLDGNGAYTGGSGGYNGTLCTAGNCSSDLVHVRADTVLTLAGSTSDLLVNLVSISGGASDPLVTSISESGDQHAFYIADEFNNPPGAGTAITLTTTSNDCTLLTGSEFVVPATVAAGAFTIIAAVDATAATPAPQVVVSARGPGSANALEIGRFDCVP